MGDIFTKDVVYDTISHCFMNMMYATRERADSDILDSMGFLPIRNSLHDACTNIYKLKNDKRKIIRITFHHDEYDSIEEYRNFIDKVLASHGHTRDDVVLIKKLVAEKIYKKCCKLAKTRKQVKLLDIYGWSK